MSSGKPFLLVAVRHGESEGNLAHHMEMQGDSSGVSLLQKKRHETNYRLTDFGRWQLQKTGQWLLKEDFHFDEYQCSDTVRGRESAAFLNLPASRWKPLSLLRERDVREYQALTKAQRDELKAKLSGALLDSPYYYHPFGEAPADLIDHRVTPMLTRVSNREFGSVIWVCHGDFLRALKSRLWHLTKDEFKLMYTDDREEASVLNGVVHMYTRIDPTNSSRVLPYFGWFKSFCPWWPEHSSNTEWIPIARQSYSSQQLRESAEDFEQLINREVPDNFAD